MILQWSWINVLGGMIITLLLIPNIVYALKRQGEKNLCENRLMNILEQVGRYGSMLCMIVCFGESGFGFPSLADFYCYIVGSAVLLSAYWIAWGLYFRRAGVQTFVRGKGPVAVFVAGRENVAGIARLKWALAILPCCLFLLCGITLRYIPLILSAVLFAVGHPYVTYRNIVSRTYGEKERSTVSGIDGRRQDRDQ